jgi:3',5'-cyclic AMP phosphodiesterase CpdA
VKIIQITDTHLIRPGETIHGLDPAARLRAVVDDILLSHADADLVVVTGDMTDRGEGEAFMLFRDEIARLSMPVRLLLGNHDDRGAFRAAFPDHPVDHNGFVQSFIDAPDGIGRLIFLDTNETGWSGGRLCAARLAWLDDRLAEVADQPVTIFMHHPPADLGLTHFEKINLADPAPFLTRLSAHPGGIRMIVIGHMHLPISGTLAGGLPFHVGRGANHHMAFDAAARDCRWKAGGPNYSLMLVDARRFLIFGVDLIDQPVIAIGAYPPGP